MGISSKIKRTLEKKLSGKQELNKEVLRWKKSLEEVNRRAEQRRKKGILTFFRPARNWKEAGLGPAADKIHKEEILWQKNLQVQILRQRY